MSWVKPNFLWMMYRSGWGAKEGQEVTLALRLRRQFFDALLAQAVPSLMGPRSVCHRGGLVACGGPVERAVAVGSRPSPVRGQAGAACHPARVAGRGSGGVRAAGAGRGHRPVRVRRGAPVAAVVGLVCYPKSGPGGMRVSEPL